MSVWSELARSRAPRSLVRREALAAGATAAAAAAWAGEAGSLDAARAACLFVVLGVILAFDPVAVRLIYSLSTPWRARWTALFLVAAATGSCGFVIVAVLCHPPGAVFLEGAALLAVGMGAAALRTRYSTETESSLLGASSALLVLVGTTLLPERWAMVVSRGESWTDAHVRWGGLLAVGLCLCLWAARDPGSRRGGSAPR